MAIGKQLFGLLLILFVFGCQSNDHSEMAPQGSEMKETSDEQSGDTDDNLQEDAIDRKLLKTGRVSFETTDLETSRKQILAAVANNKGYVASDQSHKYSGRVSNSLTIRVPADKFDVLLAEATTGVSKFDSKNIEVKDVTEEFLDISARLKTKKELEARYLQLLKKSNSVSELLEVEKQIGELRGKIESIEGRLKYLKNKIAFATLHLTFYQQVPKETTFGIEFKNGFRNGWNNLIQFLVFLVNIWPFILLLGFGLWGASRWKRRS